MKKICTTGIDNNLDQQLQILITFYQIIPIMFTDRVILQQPIPIMVNVNHIQPNQLPTPTIKMINSLTLRHQSENSMSNTFIYPILAHHLNPLLLTDIYGNFSIMNHPPMNMYYQLYIL